MYYPGYYDMYGGAIPFVNGTYAPPPLPPMQAQQRGRSRSRNTRENNNNTGSSQYRYNEERRPPSRSSSLGQDRENTQRNTRESKPDVTQNNEHCNCDECNRVKESVDYDLIARNTNDAVRREINEYDQGIGTRLETYKTHLYKDLKECVFDEMLSKLKESMESYIDDSFQYHTQEANELMRDKIRQCMENDPYRKNVLPPAPPGQQYYYIQTPEQWMQMADGSMLYLPAQSVPMLGSPYIASSGTPLQGSQISFQEPTGGAFPGNNGDGKQ